MFGFYDALSLCRGHLSPVFSGKCTLQIIEIDMAPLGLTGDHRRLVLMSAVSVTLEEQQFIWF